MHLFAGLGLLSLGLVSWARAQLVTSGADSAKVQQVAIIGAGAAGSSAAYHLDKYSAERGLAVNITVFEKTGRIGGRTLTIPVYGDPGLQAELGASIFIKINHIVYNAAQEFNLTLRNAGSDEAGILVVWDGNRFVYEQDESSWGWWNLAKLFWKYGLAPYRAQKLMQSTVGNFLKIYEEPYFPFRSLTTTAFQLNLTFVTGVTGQQYLLENNIAAPFSHDIIQASTRVNYASNLGRIHGLDTMVSLAPEGAKQVEGGNWRIFASMINQTGAFVRLNTSVSYIGLESAEEPDKSRPRYVLETKSSDPSAAAAEEAPETTEPLVFDKVIIANPYQFSDIKVGDDVFQHTVDKIPYVNLHVTLFTSPFRLSAAFFNLEPGAKNVPTTVLTTLSEEDKSSPEGRDPGAGKAGFFSVSTLRTVTNPKTGRDEYLYKIFSPDKVTPEFLTSLLGVLVPPTFTSPENDDATTVDPVSWIYPHIFHSYPKALPRVTFQDPVLGDGLYYTSGIESFISTMETSALMGKNVARLVVDDMLAALKTEVAINKEGETEQKVFLQVQEDGTQAVLGAQN